MSRGPLPIPGNYTVIAAGGNTLIKAGACTLARVTVENVGTTATLDIHDVATIGGLAPANKVYEWVSADGKRGTDIMIRLRAGLVVAAGGTFGRAIVSWEE